MTSDGTPESDPDDGHLSHYAPLGNLAKYHNATGVGYPDATVHIGTCVAAEVQLSHLEGGPATITIVD